MRNEEFVERFKREARAAGRLRHPNVVDVTDFGFAHAGKEPVAYLVMEYLDGCLKPDNIWLEPNRLGGYRVKVLDFGIAKLAEFERANAAGVSPDFTGAQPYSGGDGGRRVAKATAVNDPGSSGSELDTLLYAEGESSELLSPPEAGAQSDASETNSTQLFPRSAAGTHVSAPAASTFAHVESGTAKARATESSAHTSLTGCSEPGNDSDGTLLLDQSTRRLDVGAKTTMPAATSHGAELTRVGAIMGTPLYMSPEQCAAKHLDARSDIYSLGVIAYQMLAGQPPFSGDMSSVMREHLESAPPPLRERVKRIPKRASGVVMSALAKNPADRPQSAAAFANALRAEADSIGSLYRRAFAL